jgi:phosphatidylserine/phosphatidylglycerophosphate/cardiolipin synthase-like enzyme
MTQVFFGGPDKPSGFLRDLLAKHVDCVPPGGEILWTTYYFRDLGLADALIRARQRGVTVKICIEASPKLKSANDAVRQRLASIEGLGQGLRPIRHLLPAHLHEKVYIFSHPSPVAFIGSFNPSGNTPEDPIVIREIGDQDRGHNYLAEVDDPLIVENLRRHVLSLHGGKLTMFEYYIKSASEDLTTERFSIFYFPRFDVSVVSRLLSDRKYERVRIAVSHFRDASLARLLARLAREGTSVEVVAHDTPRRVPHWIETFVKAQGVAFVRYAHPLGLPMHNKFILLTGNGFQRVLFGSLNLTRTSLLLNHEILVAADDEPDIFDTFNARWEHMRAEAQDFRNQTKGHDGHLS